MPFEYVAERGDDEFGVGALSQLQCDGHGVGRRRRVELVEEPHPLLRVGQRHAVGHHSFEQVQRGGLHCGGVDVAGQLGHGRRVEEHRQRHSRPQPGDHAGGAERVAAEFEETVQTPDIGNAEHIGEHRGHPSFGIPYRRNITGIGDVRRKR